MQAVALMRTLPSVGLKRRNVVALSDVVKLYIIIRKDNKDNKENKKR